MNYKQSVSRFIIAAPLLCVLIFTACATFRKPVLQEQPPVTEKVSAPEYGMWFSFYEYDELCSGMDKTEFSAFTAQAVKNMKAAGITTLFLHAVAFTDAFYDSAIYPASKLRPSASYDPFALFLEAAHSQGIKVEAWINPFRSIKATEVQDLPADCSIRHFIEDNQNRIKLVNGRWYLNPAYPEVRTLVCDVARELIGKYPVDGIHLDDYFYPDGATEEFDAEAYADAAAQQPDLTLSSFRTANIDSLVSELYTAVKQSNPSCRLSISPAGNYDYCVLRMYGDPVHWIAAGTVDCLIPQIYWGFEHPTKPFEQTLDQWTAFVRGTRVSMLAGLAAYKIGKAETFTKDNNDAKMEWIRGQSILSRQTDYALRSGCDGVVYFSYRSLFAPQPRVAYKVQSELEQLKSQNAR